jgi:hypothetical protein
MTFVWNGWRATLFSFYPNVIAIGPAGSWPLWSVRIIMFYGLSIFVWFGYQDSLTAAWIAITGGIWGVAAPFLIRWQTRRKISRMYSNEDKARILGEYTLRIEPQALIEVSKAGESHIKWEDILRIEAGKNYAFIFVTLDSALIIPRATVKKGNIAEFFDEVEHRLEKAA